MGALEGWPGFWYDKTVWEGEVAVLDLSGHPNAQRCFAWSHRECDNDEGERFVAVLDIPPVNSPLDAVRASILNDLRKK